MFASYVIYSIKQTEYPKKKFNYMFASYVIYSIKQTNNKKIFETSEFASYVIYSIKQTSDILKNNRHGLLVMLFIVLSKRDCLKVCLNMSLLVMLFIVLSKPDSSASPRA